MSIAITNRMSENFTASYLCEITEKTGIPCSDTFSIVQKQAKMLHIIVTYWKRGSEVIKNGVVLVKLRKMKVYQDIVKMKFSIPNDDLSGLDKIEARLERSMDQLEALHA